MKNGLNALVLGVLCMPIAMTLACSNEEAGRSDYRSSLAQTDDAASQIDAEALHVSGPTVVWYGERDRTGLDQDEIYKCEFTVPEKLTTLEKGAKVSVTVSYNDNRSRTFSANVHHVENAKGMRRFDIRETQWYAGGKLEFELFFAKESDAASHMVAAFHPKGRPAEELFKDLPLQQPAAQGGQDALPGSP